MTSIVGIGFGSNLGEREEFLKQAFQALRSHAGFSNIRISSLYETTPVGSWGEDYLNAVAVFETHLDVAAVYEWMMSLEKDAGRIRSTPNAPRTLDVDLLFYDAEVISNIGLKIPHPRMDQRAFVLVPLNEVAPDWIHPVKLKSAQQMLETLAPRELAGIKKYENHSKVSTIPRNS